MDLPLQAIPYQRPTPSQKYDSFRRYYNKRKKLRKIPSVNREWFGLDSTSESESDNQSPTSSSNEVFHHSSTQQILGKQKIKLNETFIIRVDNNQNRHFFLPQICPQTDNATTNLDEAYLKNVLESSLRSTSSRTLNIILREMRNLDRDREQILYGPQIRMIFEKYNVPVLHVLDQLLQRHIAPNEYGFSNYEDILQYLLDLKSSNYVEGCSSSNHLRTSSRFSMASMSSSLPARLNKTPTLPSFNHPKDYASSPFDDKTYFFMDRKEAGLLLELGDIIRASPRFNIDNFRYFLQERDHYGNGQISRQHVQQACEMSYLNIGSEPFYQNKTLQRWLEACDPLGKGNIFLVEKLVDYLKRSTPF